MSLFFIFLSILTYVFSHYWAKRTRPDQAHSFNQTQYFSGSLKEFQEHFKKVISKNPRLQIIEHSSTHYLVNESPGTLTYGYFYHIKCEQKEEHLIINILAQPKLISHHNDKNKLQDKLFSGMEFQDVG